MDRLLSLGVCLAVLAHVPAQALAEDDSNPMGSNNAVNAQALPLESFVADAIQVRGIQRLPVTQIFAALPFRQGQSISRQEIQNGINALFQLGSLEDVQMFRDGDTLIVQVQERPLIREINISGNDLIDTETLTAALSDGGLEVGRVMERATLTKMKTELERQYVGQGRYGALVTATTKALTRNRVTIDLEIQEGDVAKIDDIQILGNTVFDDETLIDELSLRPSHFWSFIKGDDKYAREKLTGDLERLRSYYFDRGYVEFDLIDTQVAIDPEREDIFITVRVEEGKRYNVGDIKIRGELPVSEAKLRELLTIKSNDIFSRAKLTQSQQAMTRELGMQGYTFAEVQVTPEPNPADDALDVTFFVNPGKRVYVKRISFEGSASTDEEVYRREMRQMEGAWAQTSKIELSKARLERLPYIKFVEVETRRLPGYDDQIELVFKLEEQPSGSIGANIGYGGSGFQFGLNYNESNFLGTGDAIDLVASRNADRTALRLTHRDPHFTVDGISRGYSLIYQQTDYENSSQVTSYRTDQIGAKANFGYPISEQARLDFGIGYDQTEVFAFPDSADEVKEFINAPLVINGIASETFDTFSLEGSWFWNDLNRGLLPDEGASHYFSLEVGLPGSDNRYYLSRYQWNQYFPIVEDFTIHTRLELGYGGGYGETEAMPFYKHFFAGGIQSVRGYETRSLGPRDTRGFDSFGGNVLVESSIELILPMPFIKDKRAWRSVLFFDAGNVFNENRDNLALLNPGDDPRSVLNLSASELRTAIGIGFTWLTPIGPLSISYGTPLNADPGDELERFQFSIGQVF